MTWTTNDTPGCRLSSPLPHLSAISFENGTRAKKRRSPPKEITRTRYPLRSQRATTRKYHLSSEDVDCPGALLQGFQQGFALSKAAIIQNFRGLWNHDFLAPSQKTIAPKKIVFKTNGTLEGKK